MGSLLALARAMAAGLAIAGLSPVLAMGLGIGVAIALGSSKASLWPMRVYLPSS